MIFAVFCKFQNGCPDFPITVGILFWRHTEWLNSSTFCKSCSTILLPKRTSTRIEFSFIVLYFPRKNIETNECTFPPWMEDEIRECLCFSSIGKFHDTGNASFPNSKWTNFPWKTPKSSIFMKNMCRGSLQPHQHKNKKIS